jgi:hypothetical protein
MFRRLSLLAALVLGCTVLASAARAADQKSSAKSGAAPFVHAVIFHLKDGAPKGEVDALVADAHKLLAKISTVRGLWVGRPAEMATPKVARKFDVGLLVLFDDAEGLKKYLDDPLHKEYVEKHLKYVDEEKLAVFDFVNDKGKSK